MPTNERVTEEQIDRMAAMYADGLTAREIARRVGLHHLTVASKLKARGIVLRRGGAAGQQRSYTAAELARIRELADSGASQHAIARDLRASQSVIGRLLRSMGLEPTRPGILRGERHGSWKGGVTSAGRYLLERVAPDDPMAPMRMLNGYVPQHRLVLARALGRPLTRDETVHHRDGDTRNNALENLELRRGAHGKHQALVCLNCGSHNIGTQD